MKISAFLRPVALVLAAVILPCCNSDIGEGDVVHQVTVRVSRGMNGQEPNAPCVNPAISANGRYIVYQSAATNLAPSDGNGLVDVFIFDRETGVTSNVTQVAQGAGSLTPGDCTNPVVSQDGNLVGFISIGNYAWALTDPGAHTTKMFYLRNRSTGGFITTYISGFPLDRDVSDPSMSSDGNAVAFLTASDMSFFGVSNPGHVPQVYYVNFKTGARKLCSRKTGANPTLICASGAKSPRISPDGQYVVFQSSSSDLVPAGPATPHVYLWSVATGEVELASLNPDGSLVINAYQPNVSGDGRYVLFQAESSVAGFMGACRRDRAGSVTEAVTSEPGNVKNVALSGFPMSISGDGRFIAWRTGYFFFAGGGIRQIRVRDMLAGEFDVSCHTNGTLADADCDSPGLSANGRWVTFSTGATTLVDDDFNGLSDIYVRGPLK
jgi:TolB protein